MTLFGLVWGFCFLGVLLKVRWFDQVRKISTPLYIAMGLLVEIAFKPLLSAVQVPGVLLACSGWSRLHCRGWILCVAAAAV